MMITAGKDIRVILRTSIREYYDAGEISSRALRVCFGNGMYTVGELFRVYHEGGLPKFRNCGECTISELERILAPINKSYALQIINKLDQYEDLPEPIKAIIVAKYKSTLLSFSLDCIRRFYNTFGECKAFYSFFFCDLNDLAERFNNLGSRELKHYCYQLLSEIQSSLLKEELGYTYTYELVVMARAILWFCDDDFPKELEAQNWDLKVRRKALLEDFSERADQLVNAAASVQQYLISDYSKAVAMMQLSEGEVKNKLLEIRSRGTTYRTIFLFLAGLKETLYRYEDIEGNELARIVVANKYRYLTEKQVGFVVDFYRQYDYYPMFFLLKAYLESEIGREIDFSKERVKQLMTIAPKNLFKDKEWLYYQFEGILVTAEDDKLYTNVVEHEKVDIPFDSFAQVCALVFPLKTIRENNVRFLINGRLNGQIINKVCQEVNGEIKRIKSGIDSMQIDDLLKDIPDNEKDDYKQVVSIIIRKAYRLLVNEDGNIILPPNGVDVVYELSEILREKGRPMSLKELFAALKQRCPDVRYKKPDQIKSKVLKSNDIKPIGRSGRYAMAEWCGVYRGSIRDLVADILKKSKTPMHIDEIMEKVLQAYPFTNKESVTSSINNDKERFVLFGKGCYGLKRKRYSGDFEAVRKES